MKVKSIKINSFRNIENCEITPEKNAFIISGHNGTGKTNRLNAIHWCLTGSDMEGSNDDRANIPTSKLKTEGVVLDVTIKFDTFMVQRVSELDANNNLTQKLIINDDPFTTLKKSEAVLNQKLGLLDCILKQPKGFDIKKFLINPLYIETLAPSTFRKFICQYAEVDMPAIALKNKSRAELTTKYGSADPLVIADKVAKEKKTLKAEKESLEKVKKFLNDNYPETAPKFILDDITAKLTENAQHSALITTDEVVLEKYARAVSDKVEDYFNKRLGIKICLLEKGVGEDVFKDVCYPLLPDSKLPFAQGSTAEKLMVAWSFVKDFANKNGITIPLILIDEAENMDEKTTQAVLSSCSAINAFLAKVE